MNTEQRSRNRRGPNHGWTKMDTDFRDELHEFSRIIPTIDAAGGWYELNPFRIRAAFFIHDEKKCPLLPGNRHYRVSVETERRQINSFYFSLSATNSNSAAVG